MKNAQHVWGLPFGERAVLDFEAGASQVEIVPVEPGGAPRIEAKHLLSPLEVRQEGEKVVVRFGAGKPHPDGGSVIGGAVSMLFGIAAQGGEFRLHLPSPVKARVVANMGQAKIRGLVGCDLEMETSAGQVIVEECRGRFSLKAKAGQIIGKRLAGTFAIESGAGEAVLDIVQLDPGVHTVHSSMGSVKIELAPGIDVRIESRTVMGSTRTLYPSRHDAKAVLKVEAELGAVKVREGAPYDDPRRGDWPDWRQAWARAPELVVVEPQSELLKILELVQQKKISAEEAERLIEAL